MDMQNVDNELVYEPGRDGTDPMDYLSRHSLPEMNTDDTEMMLRQIIADKHAIILNDLRKEKALFKR